MSWSTVRTVAGLTKLQLPERRRAAVRIGDIEAGTAEADMACVQGSALTGACSGPPTPLVNES